MQAHGGTIFGGCDDRNLELARQIAEFRVECGPLAQQFCPRTRISDFIRRRPCILVRRTVANAIAARLDGMHFNRRQFFQQIRAFLKLDPVILDILARGEMAVIAIIFPRDMREHPHLPAVERAIGNGDAQHIGMQLQIQSVHQPQWLELVFRNLTRDTPVYLIAKFGNAGIDDRLVEMVIFIHIRLSSRLPLGQRVSM